MNQTIDAMNVIVRKVILSDGSEWTGTVSLSAEKDILWVTLDKGPTLTEAFFAFNDPEKTSKIETSVELIMSRVENREEYLDFTRLTDIKNQGEEIFIRLQHPFLNETS